MQVNVTLPAGAVAGGLEPGVRPGRRQADDAPESRRATRPGEVLSLRPPHRPGRAGRARRARRTQRVSSSPSTRTAASRGRKSWPRSGREIRRGARGGRGGRAAARPPHQPHDLGRPPPRSPSRCTATTWTRWRRLADRDQGGHRRRRRRQLARRRAACGRWTRSTSGCGPTTWPSTGWAGPTSASSSRRPSTGRWCRRWSRGSGGSTWWCGWRSRTASDVGQPGRVADRPARRPRARCRLKDLADVTPLTGGDAGANQVKRENVRRRIVVRCNARRPRPGERRRRHPGGGRRERSPLPEGYFVEYGGQFESQQRATRLIAVLAPASVAGHVLRPDHALPVRPRRPANPQRHPDRLHRRGASPWSSRGQTLTVASLVGFISLGGIAVRNGILLVTHYFHLMKRGGRGVHRRHGPARQPGAALAGADDRLDGRHRADPARRRRATSRAGRSSTRWRRSSWAG